MTIRIENETKERIPRQHVTGQMTRALRAIEGSPVTARVTFSDVNGPKGGADIRCALLVSVPGQAPIRVERVQTTGGSVETVRAHAGLTAAGGFAARLRYPL